MKVALTAILFATLLLGCTQNSKSEKDELMVFCAASLTDVVTEITSSFANETGVEVRLNLASSGTLARQIEMGATADLFISANQNWINYLEKEGKLASDTQIKIAGNELVLIAPKKSGLLPFHYSSDKDLSSMFKGRLSIGDPIHVPAGTYAVELLVNIGCLNELQKRFLPAKDVRSALIIVELGEVEAGIVYKTDALKSDKVKILTEFPDSLHNPIGYYMSVIKGADNNRSLQLYNYIVSEKMLPVWKKYGFKK